MNYRFNTMEELIEAYLFERDRINKEDMRKTQELIIHEIKSRFDELIICLEDDECLDIDLRNRTREVEANSLVRCIINPSKYYEIRK